MILTQIEPPSLAPSATDTEAPPPDGDCQVVDARDASVRRAGKQFLIMDLITWLDDLHEAGEVVVAPPVLTQNGRYEDDQQAHTCDYRTLLRLPSCCDEQ